MDKPSRSRRSFEIFILAALGWLLISSNHWLSFIDDETTMINAAAQPVHPMLAAFWHGAGLHEHPPLFELLFHVWLRVTGGAFAWLRLPSIFFYLLGLWLLARVGERLAAPTGTAASAEESLVRASAADHGARVTVWLGALWPYGFHYGRLAAWYALCFALLAALTLAYLDCLVEPTVARWLAFTAAAALLLWTNYLGWALLLLLALDYAVRQRQARAPNGWVGRAVRVILGTAAILGVLYIPLWRALVHELRTRETFGHSLGARVLYGGYSLYILLVSESVAPWFKPLGIAAAVCVLACFGMALRYAPRKAKPLLLYALVILAAMALAGLVTARRLLPLGVWIIPSLALTLVELPRGRARRILAAVVAAVFLIGWIGIFRRSYYAAPRFIEPWQQIADTAATRARFGWTVVSNSQPFFFYLTYALRVPPESGSGWRYRGTVTESVSAPHVFEVGDWIEAGYPVTPELYFVRGAPGPLEAPPAWDAEQWLRKHCQTESEEMETPDAGAALKSRFVPEAGGLAWRIRAFEFACPVVRTPR
jgi:hypothetical protein